MESVHHPVGVLLQDQLRNVGQVVALGTRKVTERSNGKFQKNDLRHGIAAREDPNGFDANALDQRVTQEIARGARAAKQEVSGGVGENAHIP